MSGSRRTWARAQELVDQGLERIGLGLLWAVVIGVPVGVDEFGQSGTVADLHRAFDLSAEQIPLIGRMYAAAIGLARKGHASVVLEKARQLGEIGAGIQLGPNAFHAFDYLGVGDAARKMAVYIDSLRLMDAIEGREITRIPLDDAFRTRFGSRLGRIGHRPGRSGCPVSRAL